MSDHLQDHVARIVRDMLKERFASVDDQAQAFAAAIITGLREEHELK